MCTARHDLRWLPLRIRRTRWNGTGMAGQRLCWRAESEELGELLLGGGDGGFFCFFFIASCCRCVPQRLRSLRSLSGYGPVDSSPHGLITYLSLPNLCLNPETWRERFQMQLLILAKQAPISPWCLHCPDVCAPAPNPPCSLDAGGGGEAQGHS